MLSSMIYFLAIFLLYFSYALVVKFFDGRKFVAKDVFFIIMYLSFLGCAVSFASKFTLHYWLIALCYPIMGMIAISQIIWNNKSQ